MQLFKRLNDAGTTIIQVTHSERNASYGNRIIQLKDGWVVSDNATAGAQVGAAHPRGGHLLTARRRLDRISRCLKTQ